MTMTVKQLIRELEKIENKYLEVELMSPSYNPYPVARIVKAENNRKVFIVSANYDERNK